MRHPFRRHTPYDQRFATSLSVQSARELVEEVDRYQRDVDQAERLAKCECKRCFYLYSGRIGGAAMTTWYCGLCAARHLAGSTSTPRLCKTCGTAHKLCTHCGGDLAMRGGRRNWPIPTACPVNDADD